MEKLVFINGCGIVYAAIREMITNITARGFFDPIILPSCSFDEMYKERENEKKKVIIKTHNIKINTARIRWLGTVINTNLISISIVE